VVKLADSAPQMDRYRDCGMLQWTADIGSVPVFQFIPVAFLFCSLGILFQVLGFHLSLQMAQS
jgi:hypothetical protein